MQLAQEQMGQMSQAKTILANVDAKLAEVDAKLDANDVEKDTLQVCFMKYYVQSSYKGPPRTLGRRKFFVALVNGL